MKRLVMIALALMVAVPAVGQEFTFQGYAVYNPVPDAVGSTVTVYGIANAPTVAATPVTTDFALNQYTICITGMAIATYDHDPVGRTKDYIFNGGVIQIFEDALAGGTPGDYANPGTFTDGTMLLDMAVDDGWEMDLNDPIGFGYHSGAGEGTCDVVGGSAYAELTGWGYELGDWLFFGTGISEIAPWTPAPSGYDQVFGVKIIYPHDPTANEDLTWGAVKTLLD